MLNQKLGGRYQILSYLGGGGFGQTYLATDQHLPGHPQCVVKQLKPQKTDAASLESARRLFDAEAQALYQLGTHPCIPRLLAHFEEGEQFYLVQEYIEGTLLSEELSSHAPLPEAEVTAILSDVLETLSFVHDHQVIHRDIKPSNLIRRASDRKIVMIDFGSVKQVSGQPVEVDGQVSITIAIGSMGYMPNEQLAGQPCLSSDIYAVGMLGLQALTRLDPKRLRKDPRTSEIIWRDPAQGSSPLQELLDQMIRYDHRQRYSHAREAWVALQRATGSPEPKLELGSRPIVLSDHLIWLERGDDLFQQNRYQEAIASYDAFLQIQPSHDQAWFKQGLAFEYLENYEAAVMAYDRVLQLRPEDYLAWIKRAKVLEALARYDGALAAYDEVLRLQPENYWVWCDRGQVLERQGRNDAALESYDRSIQLKPDFHLALERRKAMLKGMRQIEKLYQLQHYQEAIAACDELIQAQPHDSLAWLMRAMALENLQRYELAAISYDRVVRLQPDDQVAWFKLGSMLEHLDRLEAAAMAYSQVIRIEPSNYWAWFQRGQMLERLNRLQKAISAYNQAIQLKPDLRTAILARQALLNRLLAANQKGNPNLPAVSIAVQP